MATCRPKAQCLFVYFFFLFILFLFLPYFVFSYCVLSVLSVSKFSAIHIDFHYLSLTDSSFEMIYFICQLLCVGVCVCVFLHLAKNNTSATRSSFFLTFILFLELGTDSVTKAVHLTNV